ncbi:hypothetical protein ACJ8PU_03010 [Serratia sp. CY81489]|uniref:hypothetical protein n=1 Tax=Serratia TaxID=613 RepID=UPI0010084FC3|nr:MULTISPECIES: hypothetical protein [Serratia]MBF4188297.1 hypothetical protein [Serratia ureilytica]
MPTAATYIASCCERPPDRRKKTPPKESERGFARLHAAKRRRLSFSFVTHRPETFPISSFISRMRLLMAHLHIMIYPSAATGGVTLLPSAIYSLEMIFVRSYIAASTASP